jgi:CAAX prenyl protease-like protein
MKSLFKSLTDSPLWVRVAPFLLFLALTFGQGKFGESSRYWFYLAKTLVGVWLVWAVLRPRVPEMRWALSWEAVVTGVAVFAVWVGIDGWYPPQQQLLENIGFSKAASEAPLPWNPFRQFGDGSAIGWFFVVVRVAGSSLVVPPLEEVFYRSFLYRWVAKADFTAVPLGRFAWTPFLATAAIFGFTHNEWLAGILCGFAYQGLVCRKKRIGDAMTAHAITNLLLGGWVVWRGAWNFW